MRYVSSFFVFVCSLLMSFSSPLVSLNFIESFINPHATPLPPYRQNVYSVPNTASLHHVSHSVCANIFHLEAPLVNSSISSGKMGASIDFSLSSSLMSHHHVPLPLPHRQLLIDTRQCSSLSPPNLTPIQPVLSSKKLRTKSAFPIANLSLTTFSVPSLILPDHVGPSTSFVLVTTVSEESLLEHDLFSYALSRIIKQHQNWDAYIKSPSVLLSIDYEVLYHVPKALPLRQNTSPLIQARSLFKPVEILCPKARSYSLFIIVEQRQALTTSFFTIQQKIRLPTPSYNEFPIAVKRRAYAPLFFAYGYDRASYHPQSISDYQRDTLHTEDLPLVKLPLISSTPILLFYDSDLLATQQLLPEKTHAKHPRHHIKQQMPDFFIKILSSETLPLPTLAFSSISLPVPLHITKYQLTSSLTGDNPITIFYQSDKNFLPTIGRDNSTFIHATSHHHGPLLTFSNSPLLSTKPSFPLLMGHFLVNTYFLGDVPETFPHELTVLYPPISPLQIFAKNRTFYDHSSSYIAENIETPLFRSTARKYSPLIRNTKSTEIWLTTGPLLTSGYHLSQIMTPSFLSTHFPQLQVHSLASRALYPSEKPAPLSHSPGSYSYHQLALYLPSMHLPVIRGFSTTILHDRITTHPCLFPFVETCATPLEDTKLVNRAYRCTAYELAQLLPPSALQTDSAGDEFHVATHVTPHMTGDNYVFSIRLSTKEGATERPCLRHHVYFLIDQAASIDSLIYQAFKKGVSQAVTRLDETNLFNVFMFGNKITALHSTELRATKASAGITKTFLQRQEQKKSSTSPYLLSSFFKWVAEKAEKSAEIYSIVFLSQGNLLDEKTIAEIATLPDNVVIHTGTIGTSPFAGMLNVLAGTNRGKYLESRTKAAFPRRLSLLIKHIKDPFITGLRITLIQKGNNVIEFYDHPKIASCMYKNSTFSCFGTAKTLEPFHVLIQGKLQNRWINIRKTIDLSKGQRGSIQLERQVASRKAYAHYTNFLQTGDRTERDIAEQSLRLFGITLKK